MEVRETTRGYGETMTETTSAAKREGTAPTRMRKPRGEYAKSAATRTAILDAALEVFASMQHLRDPDGSYWTGLVFDEEVRWPTERSTWTAAAVVLAADALSSATPASGLFVGDGLPTGLEVNGDVCARLQELGR